MAALITVPFDGTPEEAAAALVVAVYGCGRYSIGTLHRAAASVARELTASLREGA